MYACMDICMCACMHVCMSVRMYVCMHACMYVCTYGPMHVCMYMRTSAYMYVWFMHVCGYVSMHRCMHACMHVCMYPCMYVCMYLCTYVSMCAYTYIHTYASLVHLKRVHYRSYTSAPARLNCFRRDPAPAELMPATSTETLGWVPLRLGFKRVRNYVGCTRYDLGLELSSWFTRVQASRLKVWGAGRRDVMSCHRPRSLLYTLNFQQHLARPSLAPRPPWVFLVGPKSYII